MNETEKREKAREENPSSPFSFDKMIRYVQKPGIDIGYGKQYGYEPFADFKGVDQDYPGYDGLNLPFDDGSLRTVHASHVLEHMLHPTLTLKEWFRVLSTGGHMIITVPHKFLYEKRINLPSRWNRDHKRFYTPAILLAEIQLALTPNSYRVIYCRDNDWNFDYTIPPDQHSQGCYEIECVIQKIEQPKWRME